MLMDVEVNKTKFLNSRWHRKETIKCVHICCIRWWPMLGRKSRRRYGKCPHMHFSTVWKFHKIIKSLTLYRKGIINWNELIAFSLMWFNQWKPQFWHIGCLEFERKSRGIQTFCWENFKKSHRYILLFLQDDWSLLSLLSVLLRIPHPDDRF